MRNGIVLSTAVVLGLAVPAMGATLTVDLAGGADYTDIQSAIDAATDGDTVLVKPGEYVIMEPIDFNRLHDPEDPLSPPVKNIVVRSEGGAEVTTIRMSETPTNSGRASVVVFENAESPDTTLEGFTVTGGSGPGTGGAWFEFGGGGIRCFESSPTLIACRIVGNSSEWHGGGFHCGGGSPILMSCTVSGNSSDSGGGVSIGNGSPEFIGCTIRSNDSVQGGGIYCLQGTPLFSNCIIDGNRATEHGGGAFCPRDGTLPTFLNCTVTGNRAGERGGGIVIWGEAGGRIDNCVLWANEGGAIWDTFPGALGVTFSCVEGEEVWEGEGNNNHDPLFCSPGFWAADKWVGGNYRLQPGSPCIGSGEGGANMGADLGICQMITVCQDGTGDFEDIQTAIDSAADGDVVTVCPGEYVITEPIDFNRLHNPEDPLSPPVKNIVVRSEGGAEVTTIRMSETPADPWRASVVVFENGEGDTSILERLVITGGSGTRLEALGGADCGGGVFVANSSPTITDCTISGNINGGGIWCYSGSSPTLSNCTISKNTSHWDGGGLCCVENSSPALSNCTISENSVRYPGCATSRGFLGGGVYCEKSSSPTLTYCTISGNSATSGGGVACLERSAPILSRCTISGNSTFLSCFCMAPCWGAWGGGVYCREASPVLISCLISGNSAVQGGGISCYHSSSTLINCTLSGNVGAGVSIIESSPRIISCIIWDNPFGSIIQSVDSPRDLLISYCCIERNPIWPGLGNINQDPFFVQSGQWQDCGVAGEPGCIAYQWDDTTGDSTAWGRWIPGDYHLQPGSLCIDAGTSDGAPTTDIEGNGRPCGAGVDIGAYEFGDCWPSTRFRRGDANASGRVDIADAISLLSYLFGPVDDPSKAKVAACVDAADANDDGTTDIADAIKILGHLFAAEGPLPGPFGECGIDVTVDDLDCSTFAPCQ